jgi:hypothetical protein
MPTGGHNLWPAEPRRMANGDVYVNTFSCGLYRMDGLDTEHATVETVLNSPFDGHRYCAVPAVPGNFWISPSATENALVVYDLSDRARAREVARLVLDGPFREPHWIAARGGVPGNALSRCSAGASIGRPVAPAPTAPVA